MGWGSCGGRGVGVGGGFRGGQCGVDIQVNRTVSFFAGSKRAIAIYLWNFHFTTQGSVKLLLGADQALLGWGCSICARMSHSHTSLCVSWP